MLVCWLVLASRSSWEAVLCCSNSSSKVHFCPSLGTKLKSYAQVILTITAFVFSEKTLGAYQKLELASGTGHLGKLHIGVFLKLVSSEKMVSILAYVFGITPSTVSGRYYHNVRLNKLSLCNSDTRCTLTIIFDSGFNGSRDIIL